LDECLTRGPHASAQNHVDFVRDELSDFLEKGFWTVLPYRLIRHLPNLRLSPLGVVPQRDRRPRLIVDLSFHGVNADTVKTAPADSMQFGRALERMLYQVRHSNPAFGPVQRLKIDIADGFYRIGLNPSSAPGLAVVLPSSPGEEPLVAIPLSLPMGWVESPPFFCAVTETAADLANRRVQRPTAPPHRLERFADTTPARLIADVPTITPHDAPFAPPPPHRTLQPFAKPLGVVDVYVDDFLAAAQGSRRRLRTIRRHLMHAIDDVFAAETGPHRQEAMSVKKLLKGDGSGATTKVILGWVLDTVAQTIALPPHRATRLRAIFDDLRDRTRVSLKTWQRTLGELRSMTLAIPGGRGLFGALQHGIRMRDRHRVRITATMRDMLDDFETLALSLAARPTRLSEIVPDHPATIGASDASKLGMGGVWFLPNGECLVWRSAFPAHVQQDLVSADHLTGGISNSDLELTGIVAHQDVLVHSVDVRERTLAILNDNQPAVSRCRKGSTTSDSAAAYLLRINSLHQRYHRYLGRYDHISGPANAMADDSSRLFHLSDPAFLRHFSQHYPQARRWRLCHLRPAMHSALTCALLKTRVAPRLYLSDATHKIGLGRFGRTFVGSSTSPPFSTACPTPSHSSKSSLSAIGTGDSPKARSASDLVPWSKFSAISGRRWPAWGPRIPV